MLVLVSHGDQRGVPQAPHCTGEYDGARRAERRQSGEQPSPPSGLLPESREGIDRASGDEALDDREDEEDVRRWERF